MSSSNTNIDFISSGQAQKEITANALFDAMSPAALFGRRASTSAGLSFGYYGGVLSGFVDEIPNGVINLTPNATNIFQLNPDTAALSVASTLAAGNIQLYIIVTNATGVAPGNFPDGGYKDTRPTPLISKASSGYTLPTASSTVKGGLKIDTSTLSITNEVLTVLPITKIPQNSQSSDYTLILLDAGKHIFHPTSDTTTRYFSLPSNASVAFDIGTSITFVNQNAAGSVIIRVLADTLRLAGTGATGDRTLAANGIATALKITQTEWLISGNGLT